MAKPPVLIVNSYGGSLTIATVQENHPVIGSYEDHNYGLDSQRLNFPDLTYRAELADWPLDLDLRGAVVIAHPPCAGFSSQNRSRNALKRGVNSAAFACTKRLLDYVLPRQPAAVAIESVPNALKGGREVHDFYARVYGYDAYRILQNACSFGVPQWRKRFWLVLIRREHNRPRTFTVRAQHNIVRVGQVLDPDVPTLGDTRLPQGHDVRWRKQVDLAKKIPLTEMELRTVLESNHGSMLNILAAHYRVPSGWKHRRPYAHEFVCGGRFLSGSLHVLNPNGFAGTLLATAWWWYGRRVLSIADYKVLMGFPADYRFHKDRMTLELLSRGVCPPVARWVLRLVDHNVFGAPLTVNDTTRGWDYHQVIHPGEIADLRPPNIVKDRPWPDPFAPEAA